MINAPSSSVGIAAIQIAKMLGANPVAITTSPEKSTVFSVLARSQSSLRLTPGCRRR
jgi:NADPH:quinone reductase-like Zn-dependent oxidoreductase